MPISNRTCKRLKSTTLSLSLSANCRYHRHYNDKYLSTQNPPVNDNLPKLWIRIPYLGKRTENLVNSCLKKIRRCLIHPVKFIIIYDTKKISYFISNKDKIPDFSSSNLVYQITCPGCNKSYIGKTDRCLHKCLSEYATQHTTSAVAQHLIECEQAQFIANFCHQYDRLAWKILF